MNSKQFNGSVTEYYIHIFIKKTLTPFGLTFMFRAIPFKMGEDGGDEILSIFETPHTKMTFSRPQIRKMAFRPSHTKRPKCCLLIQKWPKCHPRIPRMTNILIPSYQKWPTNHLLGWNIPSPWKNISPVQGGKFTSQRRINLLSGEVNLPPRRADFPPRGGDFPYANR